MRSQPSLRARRTCARGGGGGGDGRRLGELLLAKGPGTLDLLAQAELYSMLAERTSRPSSRAPTETGACSLPRRRSDSTAQILTNQPVVTLCGCNKPRAAKVSAIRKRPGARRARAARMKTAGMSAAAPFFGRSYPAPLRAHLPGRRIVCEKHVDGLTRSGCGGRPRLAPGARSR